MIEKVDFVVDDDAEAAGYDKMTTIIDIELKDGRTIRGRADFGKGSPADPDELRGGLGQVPRDRWICQLHKNRIDDIITMVRDLESLSSIDRLTAPLRM